MTTTKSERRRRSILAETPGASLAALGIAHARAGSPGEAVALDTPLGRLDLVAGPRGIRSLEFHEKKWDPGARGTRGSGVSIAAAPPEDSGRRATAAPSRELSPALRRAIDRLDAYFRGDLSAIEALEVDAQGTPFQHKVWKVLREIAAGRTTSYQDLAKKIGAAKAVRAVAACNARNPIAIVVPCHRVIGSDGSLTGYGGGLPRKRWLLEHEGSSGFLFRSPVKKEH